LAQIICRFYYEIKIGLTETTLNACKSESLISDNAKLLIQQ